MTVHHAVLDHKEAVAVLGALLFLVSASTQASGRQCITACLEVSENEVDGLVAEAMKVADKLDTALTAAEGEVGHA
jgi:hypothetical protein